MFPNRPELAVLRGKRSRDALEAWIQAFAGGDPEVGKAYQTSLERFSPRPGAGGEYQPYIGRYSPNTLAAYIYAITEFFEWMAARYGHAVAPHDATTKDAEGYVEWLATRPFSLESERLGDGDAPELLALYEAVRDLGSADLLSIAGALPRGVRDAHPGAGREPVDLDWLSKELGGMVRRNLLVRSPRLEDLRRDNPRIGIDVFTVPITTDSGTRETPLRELFVYSTPKTRAAARSTIALRVTALSMFWKELMGTEHSPVRHNIFLSLQRRVRRGLKREASARRAGKPRLTPDHVRRLLEAAGGTSLVDKRDAALLWFMVLTGARVTGATRIVRGEPAASERERTPGWFEARAIPPAVVMVKKGGVQQRLPYPPYALKALHAFQTALEAHAAPPGSQSDNPRGARYVPKTSSAWRYRLLSTAPDAPLFPPVNFWGANSAEHAKGDSPDRYREPLSRHAVRAVLHRLADKAGFSPDEIALVHAHALRHFATTAMARQGKPLREIQQILGHESITTTELYIEADNAPSVLSGQTEILDFIAGAPEPGAPPPAPKTVIETRGVPVPEPREPVRPDLPAEPPKVVPAPEVHQVKAGIVAIAPEGPVPPHVLDVKHGLSPGSPFYAYEPVEGHVEEPVHFTRVEERSSKNRDAETLYKKDDKELVQQDPWLREHYDPWPVGYGLGESSLLPWFARGSSSASGEVKVQIRGRSGERKTVTVQPLPVFASEQLYSEVRAPTLWKKLLELRDTWLKTAPTKAFGLDRWWGAFQELQRGLALGTGAAFTWVPFETVAQVGTNIRAHDEEYLVTWLEKNAERYTTTVRAFESIERPRGSARDDAEWQSFQEKFASASIVGLSPAEELPDWFVVDDPVRDIYDQSHEEFEWFAAWIGSVTGQKLTSERKEERSADAAFASVELETKISEARELLRGYFESVESLKNSQKAGDKEEAAREKEVMALIVDRLGAFGVPDPAKEKDLPRGLKERIERLIAVAFPSAGVELVDPNVLESALFDAASFRLDLKKHTIAHTDEFRAEFKQRYDGRDSECVLRRAARGMWEHVKRHGIPVKHSRERSSEYSLLYSVMLSYMAWIVPCPAEIEKRLATSFLSPKEARFRYLRAFRSASSKILRSSEDISDAGLKKITFDEGLDDESGNEVLETMLVLDSLRAEVALPSPPVTEALARSTIESGSIKVLAERPTVIVARTPGRGRVIDAPKAPATYFSVGGDDEADDLRPNAPPKRYLTPNALRAGAAQIGKAERVLPSPLRMMAAMTRAF
jgi:site-specific recombinase XerD